MMDLFRSPLPMDYGASGACYTFSDLISSSSLMDTRLSFLSSIFSMHLNIKDCECYLVFLGLPFLERAHLFT